MKLISVPNEKYEEYKMDLIFDAYKWDPQFLDSNTVAKHILVISEKEHEELKKITEEIDKETIISEEYLNKNLQIAKPLSLPKKIYNEIKSMKNYQKNNHVRLMRYDFHPTLEGDWAVSEVNSDVPGGFAEASLMPLHAKKIIGQNNYDNINFGEILVKALSNKIRTNGTIAMVHCTSYSDDRQVMQFLGDKLDELGFNVIYCAADHVRFKNNKAYSILDGNVCDIDGIVRFTPIEWVRSIKPKYWDGYFNTKTPSCNHPIGIFAQTKRFPLVWDVLEKNGIKLDTWKKYLPDTKEAKSNKLLEGYIYKPAYGRVGENIGIQEACKEGEYKEILKDVKKRPKLYLMQKKFNSRPLKTENGEEFHVCLGSYTIDAKHAGYYARISNLPRIDSNAADIPVLIEKKESSDG